MPHLETLSLLSNLYMSFIYFSCIFGTDRTSSKIFNWIGENRHPCLVPDLQKKAFTFSPFSINLAVLFL